MTAWSVHPMDLAYSSMPGANLQLNSDDTAYLVLVQMSSCLGVSTIEHKHQTELVIKDMQIAVTHYCYSFIILSLSTRFHIIL
jgi:hypothetical protein